MNASLPLTKCIIRDICKDNNLDIFQIRTNRSKREYNVTVDFKTPVQYDEYTNLVKQVNDFLIEKFLTPSAYIKPDKNGKLSFKMKADV